MGLPYQGKENNIIQLLQGRILGLFIYMNYFVVCVTDYGILRMGNRRVKPVFLGGGSPFSGVSGLGGCISG